jgi:hypothetical protein
MLSEVLLLWQKNFLFNKLENFEIVKMHDEIKNKFCEEHNITLIRIPYWERKNLNIILKSIF